MDNFTFALRSKRWLKFLFQSIMERLKGLDFSMLYVGEIQRNADEFYGYSMTDADEMKRMLQAVPVDISKAAFLDVGCGKGMCLKCAVESGFQQVAGLDLDPHLLEITRKNLEKLGMGVSCIHTNAAAFAGYADYDVFYFYNPFGKSVFEQVIQKIKDSRAQRNREIWIIYYHPVFGALFENAGFDLKNETPDRTRGTTARYYCCPKRNE